jgi:hypothetical protein
MFKRSGRQAKTNNDCILAYYFYGLKTTNKIKQAETNDTSRNQQRKNGKPENNT